MRFSFIKKITLFLLFFNLMSLNTFSWAQDSTSVDQHDTASTHANTSPSHPFATAEAQSKAIDFARQAGVIAGVAQACGQNISVFSQRVMIALRKLAANPTDLAGALLIYQQVAQTAQRSQKTSLTIPCRKVLEDYRQLPILQADYQQSVIDQLTP